MLLLVVNVGSSSLKLSMLDDEDRTIAAAELDAWTGSGTPQLLRELVAAHGRPDIVAHRVVHGGPDLVDPVVVDERVERAIGALTELAPLHQPRALAGITAARDVVPTAVQVACFDTAFHATLPAEAATYALPAEWRQRWPIRRYGFHGLSHAYAARRATQLLGADPEALRIVSCHLGSGASLCASRDGRSVETTMGFTPLDGLVMAHRSGALDPGLVLWLVERVEGGAAAVAEGLERRSGLAGIANGVGDMREIVQRSGRGDETARLALSVYLHRLAADISGIVPALGGLDALVFTGGVGEHTAEVRAEVARRLDYLGVAIAPGISGVGEPGDREISAPDARVRTLVVHAREDLEIARQTRLLLTD
jgi:acetate kinase